VLAERGTFSHPQLPYVMSVKGVQGKKLLDPVFERKDAHGQTDVVAKAREAELRVDMPGKLILIHMKHGVARSCTDGSQADFQDRIFEVPLPPNFGKE
jgi:hypothetical protein